MTFRSLASYNRNVTKCDVYAAKPNNWSALSTMLTPSESLYSNRNHRNTHVFNNGMSVLITLCVPRYNSFSETSFEYLSHCTVGIFYTDPPMRNPDDVHCIQFKTKASRIRIWYIVGIVLFFRRFCTVFHRVSRHGQGREDARCIPSLHGQQ